jgi:hypothetical protein
MTMSNTDNTEVISARPTVCRTMPAHEKGCMCGCVTMAGPDGNWYTAPSPGHNGPIAHTLPTPEELEENRREFETLHFGDPEDLARIAAIPFPDDAIDTPTRWSDYGEGMYGRHYTMWRDEIGEHMGEITVTCHQYDEISSDYSVDIQTRTNSMDSDHAKKLHSALKRALKVIKGGK